MVSQENPSCQRKNWARRQNPQRGSVDQWGAQNEGHGRRCSCFQLCDNLPMSKSRVRSRFPLLTPTTWP